MRGKEQVLSFINLVLTIALIGFTIYFFAIPGNFERFQMILISLVPIIIFSGVLFLRLFKTAKAIKEHGDYIDDKNVFILTYADKLKLELILSVLPIIMIIWFMIFDLLNFHTAGWSILIFLLNSYVLRSIFKKN